ncbi:MAG: PIG-L family deacetylase [Epsilonproteobacteria bacterium]|nr:PIG-L family deacetylase [Campylobacterota bacterium]
MKYAYHRTQRIKHDTPQILEINGFTKVLAFIPHPDDEAIGCGGLLSQLVANNIAVKVILVSDGSGGGALPEGTADTRENEFLHSLKILGVQEYELWRLPDGKLDTLELLPSDIAHAVREYCPNIVLSPWYLDMHPDHSAVGYAVKQCADKEVCDVLFYEVWSPVECTHILDITESMEIKIKALEAHHTALQYGHYLQALRGLATYRGLYLPFDTIQKYGEAYYSYRKKRSFLNALRSYLKS